MTRLIISSEHVADLIAKAIEDTKNGIGIRLLELAAVLDSVAVAVDEPFLHTLPNAVGGFGTQLMTARALVLVPVLPDQQRNRLSVTINTAVEAAVSSLETIRIELCAEKEPDQGSLMTAVGKLFQQASILMKEERALAPPRSSQPSMPE